MYWIRLNSFCRRIAPAMTLGVVALCAGFSAPVAGQTYPQRPISLIFPFAPAGTGVTFATVIGEAAKILGQPIIIDYKPGAGGRFGLIEMSKAKGDGYVLGAAPDAVLTVLPQVSATIKGRMGTDYLPVANMAEFFYVLTTHPSMPFRDFQSLVAYAKANPGKLNFAGSERGGVQFLHLERIKAAAGIELTNIPYNSSVQSIPDRLSGTVELGLSTAIVKPYIETGKLIGIATTATKRMHQLPQFATLDEAGLKGFTLASWFGVIAPPGTPPEIVNKLNAAFNVALKAPEVVKLFDAQGFEPTFGSAEDFASRIRLEASQYAPIIKRLDLKIND